MSSQGELHAIEDTIHIGILSKMIVRRFLRFFRLKYLKMKKFQKAYQLEKDFILNKRHGLE